MTDYPNVPNVFDMTMSNENKAIITAHVALGQMGLMPLVSPQMTLHNEESEIAAQKLGAIQIVAPGIGVLTGTFPMLIVLGVSRRAKPLSLASPLRFV